MTSDESIMQEMLERATNATREIIDELAVQMFCMVVRSNTQLITKAQDLIITKIRSSNTTESNRAISLLEECMSKCGTEFQDETAKFRFLNELIRLVSKKYQGAETPCATKKRIMEALLLWTTEYPQKVKIREAYDMLIKEGVEHGNTMSATATAAAAKREDVLGIDEKTLSYLIKSGDPQNFKRANLLIQYRVNQEDRRTELLLQHKLELQEVMNTVSLLNQMLDTYETDNRCGGQDDDCAANDTTNLIRELYLICKKHKPVLQRLPELMENVDENLIVETLEANDLLLSVMKRYKEIIVHAPSKANQDQESPASTVVNEVNKDDSLKKNNTDDLLSELLGVTSDQMACVEELTTITRTPTTTAKSNGTSVINPLDELNEIFGNADLTAINTYSPTKPAEECNKYSDKLLSNVNDILEPVNVFSNCNNDKTFTSLDSVEEKQVEKRGAFRKLGEIDQLSEELMKQNLPTKERIGSFKNTQPEKLTLNDLVKEKLNIKTPPVQEAIITSNLTASTQANEDIAEEMSKIDDDEILTANPSENVENYKTNSHISSSSDTKELNTLMLNETHNASQKFLHLSDINIDLDDLTPKAEDERVLLDDDVKVTLNFTEDRPSRNVCVIVLAVSNKSRMHVMDFQFEASVRKPSKVRLLPPTDIKLAPYKPYRPPTPINQILLLYNPSGKAVDVTCILGYKLGDDPDPIKESIVAKDIPYVD